MKKIDQFTNLYDVSKTLRFRAIPVGKTQENITMKRILEEDETRAEAYADVKKLMDRYHKVFIDRVLSGVQLNNLDKYIELFLKQSKSDAQKKELELIEADMRMQIAEAFPNDEEYKKLFGKEMVKDILPSFLQDEEELEKVASFSDFTTSFVGFYENRKNMYSQEAIATGIAHRCINENLPKFITNMTSFQKIKNTLGEDILKNISAEINEKTYTVEDIFKPSFFSYVLPQSGITFYNTYLGGYTTEKGEKIKGLNEYVNLYNQQLNKTEKEKRLPLLKPLFKQILSESDRPSFYSEGFKNDQEVLNEIKYLFSNEDGILKILPDIKELFSNIHDFDQRGIYINNGVTITGLSNELLGNWNGISEAWNDAYDMENMKKPPKDMEKYYEKRQKVYKGIRSFSLEEINGLMRSYTEKTEQDSVELAPYYTQKVCMLLDGILAKYSAAEKLLDGANVYTKSLYKDENSIAIIKELLDSVKALEALLKPLQGTGKEDNRDEIFYGTYDMLLSEIMAIDNIYNKVRDYVVRKPYSCDKYKLYFENPQFMGGWDRNKVNDYRATLLRKDNLYYIVIIDKKAGKVIDSVDNSIKEDYYEKINYKLLPGPNKMLPKVIFSKKNIEFFHPSEEIQRIYNTGTFKKGPSFKLDDCHKLIDFFKECLGKHPEWSVEYNFEFSDTESYEDISVFYREVEKQGYKVSFDRVSATDINQLVEEGKIYLFQLYNKDFSKHSHGKKNLHTMYFEMLFSDDNLRNSVIKLNGGAELFFRKASIKKEDLIIHKANLPIANKNPLNPKKESQFTYDIIKDRRYAEDQYEFHVPVTINWCPGERILLNDKIRQMLKQDENPYVIGIDRGERNLIYVCVIDYNGTIVEQMSLNEIINENKGVEYRTDYHGLLDKKERERKEAKQNWTTVANIKELKEGYISQVVRKICDLVIKYDAVIAMEDLNSGFKNSRVKVEKQVYQKFEKMLIDKLNYLVDKNIDPDMPGGVLCGYQLANKFESFAKMGTQNGFIFYIPAWLTSKIDPITGFVDLLKPKYSNVEEARQFIMKFDAIRYNETENYFEFVTDYSKFARTEADYKKRWIICTNGDRIRTFRNADKNSEWDNEVVVLTDEYKALFDQYGIDIHTADMRADICSIEGKDFYNALFNLLRLTLQMRNSITGRTDVDYLISPVKNEKGEFYDSRDYENLENAKLPKNADANGAYNIARKVLWAIRQFKNSEDSELKKTKIAISNKEWLQFAQSNQVSE